MQKPRFGGAFYFLEARDASGFGFVGIHREGGVTAATGMGDVIGATADGAAGPGVDDIEHQRCLNADGGMQR